MSEWALEAWRILLDEIMCIQYGPRKNLLVSPRYLENADVDLSKDSKETTSF